MNMIDVTVPIRPGLPRWPGDPAIELERFLDLDRGDPANASRLSLGVHTGTHVDAPLHFLRDGGDVAGLALSTLIGPAFVLDVGTARAIGPEQLEPVPAGVRRLLLKTSNSRLWDDAEHRFRDDYVALTSAGARWLVERGVLLVGIDYLSIQLFADEEPDTHRALLEAGVVIVEGLDLRSVDAGEYELICLPLRLPDSDGAPARVVLGRER